MSRYTRYGLIGQIAFTIFCYFILIKFPERLKKEYCLKEDTLRELRAKLEIYKECSTYADTTVDTIRIDTSKVNGRSHSIIIEWIETIKYVNGKVLVINHSTNPSFDLGLFESCLRL